MKMKVEHVIPLSRQAIVIVREALVLSTGSRWLFPSKVHARALVRSRPPSEMVSRIAANVELVGIRIMPLVAVGTPVEDHYPYALRDHRIGD